MPKRPAPADRRGAFDTWGDSTWEALLVRPLPEQGGGRDPAGALAACAGVGAIERDVTDAVLAGEWVPPQGEWALLVVPRAGGWATLVSNGWAEELIERRLGDFRGETLVTGAYDTAGVLVVRHRRHEGGATAEAATFVTDGVRWDEPAPDDDPDDPQGEGDTSLSGERFPPAAAAAWLAERASVKDAHDTLLRDADAYVPGLFFARDGGVGNSGRLVAGYGHEDALSPEFVERVDVVRFGPVQTTPLDEAAGRRLEAAVGRGDVRAARRALAAGATVGTLPGSRHTAVWLCLNAMSEFDAPDRAALAEIVGLLLDAGADVNARPRDAASPVELLLTTEFVQSRATRTRSRNRLDALALLDWLIDAGLKVDAVSFGRSMYGPRPLHAAASQNRPAFVRALLDRGADPRLADDRGLTPGAALRAQLEAGARRTWAPNHVPLERALAEHAEVLALLDAAAAA
ncbi:ankyrin repeat domain-containing protein [Alienimonas californiensis]|uniref:Ankyrin repeats (3 copies) n=1 Tax=Alienimonas californiensis TaxID=2527989 RepID=A0A517P7W6_9PLAN|nr:ankyrin repeat domain-containing protein [Alienimonas californiensis]QDT15461.1 Ankyrin repeats (3 copies) [Alienimonas californiensis]